MRIDESSREFTTPCDKSVENPKNANALKVNEEEEEKLRSSSHRKQPGTEV